MRLFVKILLYSLVLTAIPLVVVAWLCHRDIRREVDAEVRRELQSLADLLTKSAVPVLEAPPGALQDRVRDWIRRPGLRFTVIDPEGNVLADTDRVWSGMENHLGRPEFQQALTAPYGYGRRRSATVQKDMVYVARRVERDGRVLGFVRTSLPLGALAKRTGALRGWVTHAAVVSLLLCGLLAAWIARRTTGNLRAMGRAADAIVAGDYQRRVPAPSADEIGDLCRALNAMASHFEAQVETIGSERGELAAILGAMVEGVIAVDADEHVVHCNRAAGQILGVDPDDTLDQPIWEVVRLARVPDILREVMRTGARSVTSVTMAREGPVRTLRLHAAPLRGADGPAKGAVLVVDDVTELRRLEHVRRDFVANASHELKTPVAAIRGLTETLLDDPAMPPERQRRFLERVLTQSDRLQALVEEMLALSRLEAPQQRATTDLVDVREPIAEACDAVAPLAREREIAFRTDIAAEPLLARGQREALRRIAANLLDNAVKYTPHGGQVSLALAGRDERVILTVSDTGRGIPADKQDRIFERFFRIDDARDREAGGSGLGLAIVKHLALSLGGDVTVEAEIGRGSRFVVTLPAAPTAARAP